MVSGPAAGLTAIVLAGIQQVGGFPRFLPAVVLAGGLQLAMGAARAGVIGYYFPSSVIRGMLAAIGLTLILKQIPHAVGYDADFEGDLAFVSPSGETTFSAIAHALQAIQPGAVVAALLGIVILLVWPKTPLGRIKLLPAALVAVLVGVGVNEALAAFLPDWAIRGTHLVALPPDPGTLMSQLTFPEWGALADREVWTLALTLGIVASLESLLSLEATNKIDPLKREAPASRELLAQGAGNVVSGLLGGLPLTGVIVRSSANVDAGGRTRLSAILHAVLLLLAVFTIAPLLNRIPLAALAAVLLVTGYKLTTPGLWRASWQRGPMQFIPFATTIVAVLLTDLLIGIAIGFAVGIAFIVIEQMRRPAFTKVSPPGAVLTRFELPNQVTFLGKASLRRALDALPSGTRVEIDGRKTSQFDHDALEVLLGFRETAKSRNIDYRLVGIPDQPTAPAH
jgi:carbonic anhydrase